jgi:hypothetical protein
LQNFDSFTPPKAEGECNIGFSNESFAIPQSQSRMGFKSTPREGERLYKRFVFSNSFFKNKPGTGQARKAKMTSRRKCILGKRFCRNKLPNDLVIINYQAALSQ